MTRKWQIILGLLSCENFTSKQVQKLKWQLKELKLTDEDLWQNPRRVGQLLNWKEMKIVQVEEFKKRFSLANYEEFLLEKQIKVVTIEDEDYPPLLKYISDYPLLLFQKGDISCLHQKSVAVVGTRKPTAYGREVVQKLVTELVREGFVIVSGYMYGMDTLAHQATVQIGGKTVGIVGYGFDHFYPAANRIFVQRMLSAGQGFLSEYAPWQRATNYTFPLRNRLVAGTSLGTLVIEAGAESGSLITANLAVDYGREVFAVPGPITSGMSDGTRSLLNLGATLVASGEEITETLAKSCHGLLPDKFYEDLGIRTNKEKDRDVVNPQTVSDDVQCQKIYEYLWGGSANLDKLTQVFCLPAGEIMGYLSLLELLGVVQTAGEYYEVVC